MSRKIKKVAVRFVPQSSEEELYCRDGEISGWIVEDDNSGGDDEGDSGDAKRKMRIEGVGGEIMATLPPGMRRPVSVGDEIIVLADDGRLMLLTGDNYTSRRELGRWDKGTFGELRSVISYGEIMTLTGSERMAWLVRSDNGAYSFRTSLPGAPVCEMSLWPTILSPYIEDEDGPVTLSVAVRLDIERTPYDAMALWITGGDSGGVEADVRMEIYKSVGESISQYLSAVSAAGLATSPMMGFASLCGRLPGERMRVGSYQPPVVWIDAWNYISGVLCLDLRLSAVPCRASARVKVTDENVIWSDVFPRLDVCLTESVRWWESSPGSGVEVTGLCNVNYEGKRRRGFVLYAKSIDEYYAALGNECEYKLSGSVSTRQSVEGVVSLRRAEKGASVY
ncbi:MAG: hypothetical protein K2M03_02510, partial [Muribaculaceae bacterium]|nr:hypothetical protein [Muribaculaceae bacterium]